MTTRIPRTGPKNGKVAPSGKVPGTGAASKKTLSTQTIGSVGQALPRPSGVSEKDIKLLWGRAAARCSFAECRAALTDAPGATTYGNICHIVAESRGGPRGDSDLSLAERNSYANLILLCGHHHDLIDKGAGPANWSVARLHDVKVTHELWVEESLTPSVSPRGRIYADVVSCVSEAAHLQDWTSFSESAANDQIPYSALLDAQYVEQRRRQILWPADPQSLDAAAQAAMDAFVAFVFHFDSFSEITENGKMLRCDNSFKRRYPNPDYDYWATRRSLWSDLNFWLLAQLCHANNVLADEVRRYVNPNFFATYGRFLIHDELGYRGMFRALEIDAPDIQPNISRLTAAERDHLASRPQ